MQRTQEDENLLQTFAERIEQFRQGILRGRPYVWELRLSLEEFNTLESAIGKSISSHNGSHKHLLTKEFAVVVVIYLAEWYKRLYNGSDTDEKNRIINLNNGEPEKLYELAQIDKNTFAYKASENNSWLGSLYVLGGLAVQAELKHDANGDLLSRLCKIYHGEDVDFGNVVNQNRAAALRESITKKHSLYEYLRCVLGRDDGRQLPFAESDCKNENTGIPQLIHRIKDANRISKKDKFNFEWVVYYTAGRKQMVRHLLVKLKPEEIGGGKKQYIYYDRLRLPEWGVEHPEKVGRISFYLRFKNKGRYIQKERADEEPLFKYDNTGSEVTGFLSVNNLDENTYANVPVDRFDKVEIVMKFDGECRKVQELEVKDYMQVYSLSKTSNKFSNSRNPQRPTYLIFSSDYHLIDEYKNLPVSYACFRNGEKLGENYCWCPINDKVIIADIEGREVTPPFFNRNGLYQVVTKKYLKTIQYKENLYVLYQWKDSDEDELLEEPITVLFGRNGLQVIHYKSGQTTDFEYVLDYKLEWQKSNGKYVNWNEEEPKQGLVRLRVTVKDVEFKLLVYYIPFVSEIGQDPIWRDFEHQRICTSLDGVDDIQDDFKFSLTEKEAATTSLEIGPENSKIVIEVYRPVIVRELSQKCSDDGEYKIVSYHEKKENIYIPLINCDQFSIRDFSENGVKEYQIQNTNSLYYGFSTFNQTNLSVETYAEEHCVKELAPNIPLDCLKIYMTRPLDDMSNLYAWDYQSEPFLVNAPNELTAAEGIVFQSLKVDDSPREYVRPIIKKRSGWGGKKSVVDIDPLYCYETAAEHKTYFFLFNPLIKVIVGRTQIRDIFLPLLRKRNGQLNDMDIGNLYRFALHFHFDWMLLPRTLWINEINSFATTDEDRGELIAKVTEFFSRTPKCTDEHEKFYLTDFLNLYWNFDKWPKVDDVADTALKLIKDEPDALGKMEMKDYLKLYDVFRYKFNEMSRAIATAQ